MSNPRILFGQEAREKLLQAVKIMEKAVCSTLGPKGKNCIVHKKFGDPVVTKDGVSVAKVVTHEDLFVNMALSFLTQAAIKTNEQVGDGTTTTIALASAILRGGLKSVAAGSNPIDLKRGLDKALDVVVKHLYTQAKEIKHPDKIKQIATISANGDVEIGKLIAEAVEEVGRDGVITVGENKSMVSELDVVAGMQFDKGYQSPYFVTDRKKMVVELTNPRILIAKKKISSLEEILPLLELISKTGESLLIIAEAVEGKALAALVLNNMRGMIKVATVGAPGFGNHRDAMLEDIAVLTGGHLICDEAGMALEKVTLKDLGRAKMVTIKKDETVIIEGAGSKEAIEERVAQIKQSMEDISDYEREKRQERIAKLAGGVANILVGAPSEVEMKERKDRVEDALNATRAAIDKGIVAGGGVSYVRAMEEVAALLPTLDNQDQATGAKILRAALGAPLKRIASNAGVEPFIILQKVSEGQDDFGYNAARGEFCQMEASGIIDPLKVVLSALQTSTSIAGTVLTMECMVREPRDEKGAGMPGGPMGGGMM